MTDVNDAIEETTEVDQGRSLDAPVGPSYYLGSDPKDRDVLIRQTALYQACHDVKGKEDAAATVARAETYLAFLKAGE